MILFWVVAGVLTAAAAALILMRARGAAAEDAAGDPAAVLYRRQLSEIDELADRGLMGEAERKSAHAEAARRLLAAADAPKDAWAGEGRGRGGVLAAVVAVPALTLGLYLALGAPGYPDRPYAQRLAEWKAADLSTLGAAEIAAVLRDVIRTRPADPEGYRFLALAEGQSGNVPAAVRALRRAVELAPDRTDLRRSLGEALVYQAGGKVEADARAVFEDLLRREPGDPAARFYLAQAKVEAGQRAEGAAELRALLADVPADEPRREIVEAAIAKAEGRGAAAAAVGPQAEAIRGMVEGLAARLEENPDDPEGWVRLVRSYSVLGEDARRDAALATARARYADRPQVLQQLEEAARAAPME
ncbi:c-type cytochrome biogenesis protein CcmI [Phenylobacterium zucineum]|uniref:c-type cytochrome biogenesis protein CcmI n=1 Tax=Phenylobacterium zucineum TaxID=284016 RepID=UPI0002EC3040|nr:c-type cytochrome biogenesis protein CcmI [Phenylobacterium zucineum]